MLKGKFKISHRLSSLVVNRFENKKEEEEVEVDGLDFQIMEEELETFHLKELGEYIGNGYENFDIEIVSRSMKEIPKQICGPVILDTNDKQSELDFLLSQKTINLERLQRIASTGLPHEGGLRATAWKLLLGYLPASQDLWEGELAANRSKYAALKDELLSNPSEVTRRKDESLVSSEQNKVCGAAGLLRRHEILHSDHPLSEGNTSIWHQYFQDAEIGEQIDRDLQRTHPGMKFFSGNSSLSCRNRQSMRNVLLLFAKLNPAIRYVQGMNEVLAPLYHVFCTDPDEKNAVNPQFYAFRWITLLLTQEFKFTSILRIWDSLLGSPSGVQEMLLRVCCAMLLSMRSRLLSGDFTANLNLLQHYPEVNMEYLLQLAQELSSITSS
ncbi:hypothetical protein IFM89_021389 [Coptis chinensis]|uniref:Rab-GAP TBC domain-containing protein n=1 Tax=Coptis chinensis TaxID=261450 RepID=A0A835IDL5_9MAGN|nr:hypothetical protein IFM89_021389 [Coptis chinensis]